MTYWNGLSEPMQVAIVSGCFVFLAAVLAGFFQLRSAKVGQTSVERPNGENVKFANDDLDETIRALTNRKFVFRGIEFSATEAALVN